MEGKYLIFYSDKRKFLLDFEDIKIIIPAKMPEPIPDFPSYVMGLLTYEGAPVPIINLRTRFGYEPKEITDRDCIIITAGEKSVGLLCDKIDGFAEFEKDKILPPPDLNEEASARFLKGEFLLDSTPCYVLSPELIIKPEDEKTVLNIGNNL